MTPLVLTLNEVAQLVLNPGMQMPTAPASGSGAAAVKAPKVKVPHIGQGQPCKPGWSAKSTGCIPKQKPQPKVRAAAAAPQATTPKAPAATAPVLAPAPVPAAAVTKPPHAGQAQTTAANMASRAAAAAGGDQKAAADAHIVAAAAHRDIASKAAASGNQAAADAHNRVAAKHDFSAKSHQDKSQASKPKDAAPQAEMKGQKVSDKADASSEAAGKGTVSHEQAMEAHLDAASSHDNYARKARAAGDKASANFHDSMVEKHEAKADFHKEKASVRTAQESAKINLSTFSKGLANSELSSAALKEHTAAVAAVTGRMSDNVHQEVAKALQNVHFAESPEHLSDIMAGKNLGLSSAEWKKSGAEYGSANGINTGGGSTIVSDGASGKGESKGAFQKGFSSAEGVLAHEMTHSLDHGFRHSGSKEWQDAWQKEIANSGKLTEYAGTVKHEGFAEFGRLLYGSSVPHADIEKAFPKASAYFKSQGFWPNKQASGQVGNVRNTPGMLTEMFGGRKQLPTGPGDHMDLKLTGNVLSKQEQDDGTDAQPAEDRADAGQEAGDAGQQGGAAEGDEGQDQDGGQAAVPVAGEVEDGKPALQGPELEAATKQMMAELMAGFHGLMADNMHDLAGTSDEQDGADGGEGEGQEDGTAGQEAAPKPADGEEGDDTEGAEGLKKPPVENAHRCSNCGYAMDEAEWEDEECPQCGEVVNNEQERAPNGQFGSGDGSLAKGWAAVTRLTGKVDALISKIPLLGLVKDAGKAAMGKIHSGLESRYGPKVAGTVMGSGFFGGYGVAGTAMKLFAFPGLPFVNDLVAIGVLAGVCEAGLQAGRAYRKLTGNEDLSEPREWVVDQMAQLVWKLIRQYKAELAQQVKGHEDAIAEAAEEWKSPR